jgi:hypothetical protein
MVATTAWVAASIAALPQAGAFGTALPLESSTTSPVTSGTPGPELFSSMGYIMATSNGAVLSYGGIPLEGDAASAKLQEPVVSIASTPDGKGYWMASADGGVFAFGDAAYDGSAWQLDPSAPPGGANSVAPLRKPVTDIASSPDGHGYWLVASDGGVFTFGDATFHGSMGGVPLVKPVQGIAPTADGGGYWLVASDGGVFTFGDATFHGSMGGVPLNAPVVGIAPTADGGGYWLVALDGGIFTFGNAGYFGSASQSHPVAPIVGIAATPDGGGYWEVSTDGGVFAYGDAPFRGSDGSVHDLFYPVVSFATAPGSGTGISNGQSEGLDRYVSGSEGYDISWPQCSGNYPPASAIAVVGVTDGYGMSTNPCFASEAAWAGVNLSVYMNADFFAGSPPASAMNGPAGSCQTTDLVCQGYNWGWASAAYAYAAEQKAGYSSDLWWLDVETANNWSASTAANASAIHGMIDYLNGKGVVVGIYSTAYQWGLIAGSYQPGVPNWYATGSAGDPPFDCSKGFTGGPTWLVQAQWTGSDPNYDADYAC